MSCLFLGSFSDILDQAPDGKISHGEILAIMKDGCLSDYANLFIPSEGHRYFFYKRGPVDWSDEALDSDAEAESWITSGSSTLETFRLFAFQYAVGRCE